jgi:hypothetical protein
MDSGIHWASWKVATKDKGRKSVFSSQGLFLSAQIFRVKDPVSTKIWEMC